MLLINQNKDLCLAIFKHLLTNPELSDKFSFRSEYFKTAQNETDVYKMYIAMRGYMKDYPDYPYSKNTAYYAWFDRIRPELNNAFQTNAPDKRDEISRIKQWIDMFIDAADASYAVKDVPFIEKKIVELVKQMSIYYRIMATETKFNEYLKDPIASTEEFYDDMIDAYDSSERKYSINEQSNSIYEPWDPRLMVKVSKQVYPTKIQQLNLYLTGGFRKQTLTGFLTKTAGGKTTLLVSLAADALRSGQNVAFVNLEMNNHEVWANILSASTLGHSYEEIFNNLTDEKIMGEVRSSYESTVSGQFVLISDRDDASPKKDFDWLGKRIEEAEKNIGARIGNDEFRFDLIFIDYLYLMDAKKKMNRNNRADQEYQQKVVECHKWAQEKEYAVITVFQGNRGAEQKLKEGEQIDLTDMGDSYAAARDLEYMFAVGKYKDFINGYDGITIYPLKTRHYDGDWDKIYVPYNSFRRGYDTLKSEVIEFEEEDDDDTDKKSKKKERRSRLNKPKVDFSDFLRRYPDIREMPLGTISNTFGYTKLFKYNWSDLDSAFTQNGWKKKTKNDFEKPDYEAMRKRISEAIVEYYTYIINKPSGKPTINITGQNLFE